jgi:hypothetical protein
MPLRKGHKKNGNLPHGSLPLNNKPIIITFLAMEKVIFAMYYNNKHPHKKVHRPKKIFYTAKLFATQGLCITR